MNIFSELCKSIQLGGSAISVPGWPWWSKQQQRTMVNNILQLAPWWSWPHPPYTLLYQSRYVHTGFSDPRNFFSNTNQTKMWFKASIHMTMSYLQVSGWWTWCQCSWYTHQGWLVIGGHLCVINLSPDKIHRPKSWKHRPKEVYYSLVVQVHTCIVPNVPKLCRI